MGESDVEMGLKLIQSVRIGVFCVTEGAAVEGVILGFWGLIVAESSV